ncbi:MAG TPA: hypothetical protein VKT73_12230 [Xanthobacteraceae bacterium]|nr:hypothetical protein [Xanthobacteraceae bacterium]
MTRKFLLAIAFALAASAAVAADAVPDTIYNPNVPFPSYDDVQSLRIFRPEYGLREQLHLDAPWSHVFENGVLPQEEDHTD